jgi:hypothetical protein
MVITPKVDDEKGFARLSAALFCCGATWLNFIYRQPFVNNFFALHHFS